MYKGQKSISKILISLYLSLIIGVAPSFADDSLKLKGIVGNEKGIGLKGEVKIDDYSQKINLSLRNTDLKQVLRMLADKANLNILVHDSVNGKVSLDLIDVSLNKAFEYVMTVNGLSYWKDGNTLIVASKSKSAQLGLTKREMKPIDVKYIDAGSVAGFLNANIFSLNRPDMTSAPIVVTNPRTNQLYVFGNDADIAMAEKTVEMLDVKPLVKMFNVNYTNPTKVAGNVCNLVFGSSYTSTNNTGANGANGGANGVNGAGAAAGGANGGANGANGGAQTAGGFLQVQPRDFSNGFNLVCGQSNQYMINATNAEGSVVDGNNASITSPEGENSVFSGAGNFEGVKSSLESLNVLGYAVLANDETSQISVMGTEQQLKLVEDVLNKFDKRPLQAYFDISVIEVTETNTKNLNSVVSYVNKYGDSLNLDSTGLKFDPHNLHQKTVTTATGDFQVNSFLNLTKGKLLSNPRLIVSSNTEAKFNVTDKAQGPVTSIREADGNGGFRVTYSIGEAIDLGIEVTIKPVIKPNGEISLNINPTYTTLIGTVEVGNEDTGIASQSLTAEREVALENVIIKDNETFVLGGLIRETDNKQANKIPVISAIPIIGGIFGSTETARVRSELIFVITPHIIKDPANIPSESESL